MNTLATTEKPVRLTFDHHPEDLPEIYCMEAMGICMEPVIADGTKLLFSRVDIYRPGDIVALFKRPECTIPGEHQIIVKKLVLAPGNKFWTDRSNWRGSNLAPTVIVEMLNPRKMLYIDPDALFGIHKCLGPVPAGHQTIMRDDTWIRAQAKARRNGE